MRPTFHTQQQAHIRRVIAEMSEADDVSVCTSVSRRSHPLPLTDNRRLRGHRASSQSGIAARAFSLSHSPARLSQSRHLLHSSCQSATRPGFHYQRIVQSRCPLRR